MATDYRQVVSLLSTRIVDRLLRAHESGNTTELAHQGSTAVHFLTRTLALNTDTTPEALVLLALGVGRVQHALVHAKPSIVPRLAELRRLWGPDLQAVADAAFDMDAFVNTIMQRLEADVFIEPDTVLQRAATLQALFKHAYPLVASRTVKFDQRMRLLMSRAWRLESAVLLCDTQASPLGVLSDTAGNASRRVGVLI